MTRYQNRRPLTRTIHLSDALPCYRLMESSYPGECEHSHSGFWNVRKINLTNWFKLLISSFHSGWHVGQQPQFSLQLDCAMTGRWVSVMSYFSVGWARQRGHYSCRWPSYWHLSHWTSQPWIISRYCAALSWRHLWQRYRLIQPRHNSAVSGCSELTLFQRIGQLNGFSHSPVLSSMPDPEPDNIVNYHK